MARRAAGRCLLLLVAATARRPTPIRLNALRGGADDFDERVGAAFVAAAQASESETSKAAQSIDEGKVVEGLGDILGSAYDKALQAFDAQAPPNSGEDRARLVEAIDSSLELLFVKQLALVRAKLLKDDLGDVERVVSTLDDAAEAARRPGADWESSSETAAAAAISREVRSRQAKVADVAAKAQKQQQAYLQVFQLYQAQIAQLKQAVGEQPATLQMSYRVPDTDLALSASRSDDRTTLSLTCVPDDSAPLLGPQGFVRGVTPLDLGLTLNLNI